MPFEFDLHGWFAGGTAADGLRTVPMAPPPEPEPQLQEAPRIVSVLGFRRRFTPAEKAAIEWAAVDRPDQPEAMRMQAAALRATLADQAAAQFIHLDDPATVAGVQGLEALGIIAPGRALEILTAPIKTEEIP